MHSLINVANQLPKFLKWIFFLSILAILVGSASAFFLITLDWAVKFRQYNPTLILMLPIVGFITGCLYHYFGKEIETGNNLIISQIQNPTEVIPFKMAPFVYFGTMLTHLFGGSAGREGTALQMAAGISDPMTRILGFQPHERQCWLICAVAAGFGSVFGTPIAGAVFALEVYIVGKMSYKFLLPAIFTSVLADYITRIWGATHTSYTIGNPIEISPTNLVYVCFAALIFGLCARLFSYSMHQLAQIFKSTISFPPLRPAMGGIILALIFYNLPFDRFQGLGISQIVVATQEPLPCYDFLLKIFLTVITVSSGFKGGEVTPLFFIGATLGNALAYFIPIPLPILAGLGFVAVFAGAAKTPIACVFMGVELFGSGHVVFFAIACTIAYLVSGSPGIYKMQKTFNDKSFDMEQ